MVQTIYCGSLFNGESDTLQEGTWVTIDNGVIVSVTQQKPDDAVSFLDLNRYYVLPGYIDCHDHVCLDPGNEINQAQETNAWLAIRGAARVRSIVEAGVTTLRNAGEHERIDISLKRAIEMRMIPGPRLVTAGIWICRTGGASYWDQVEADGPWEIRKAIREETKYGVDWIKIMVTGDYTTPNSDALVTDYTGEEILAAVDEAHRLGKPIAAHAHGGKGVDYLIEAGVDSIEHGFYLSEEQMEAMAKKGIYLCNTYGIVDAILNEPTSPDYSVAGCRKYKQVLDKMVRSAIQHGVPIVVGTDGNHGKMAVELEALVRNGYSSVQALRAMTSDAARLLGLSDQVGAIKRGLRADLVAIEGDPLREISAIGNIAYVIKDGEVVVGRPA